MNEPIDHHCIPVFYLSRWAGADQRAAASTGRTATRWRRSALFRKAANEMT